MNLFGILPQRCNLEVYTDSVSRLWAEGIFKKEHILKEDLIIGIAPCGGDAFGKDNYLRRWPPERFTQLIDRLVDGFKAKVFIFAGPDEKNDVTGIISPLKNKTDVFEFCDSSLEQTVALVERCQLFISNDTGILRFADALNKKIVALYGPIDEKVYGPYPYDSGRAIVIKKDLDCRPCYHKFRLASCLNSHRCMSEITVDEVLQAVKKLLGKI